MSLELRVLGGALDGQSARFDRDSVLVGRDPNADLRLDPLRDRDASARHAEIRRRDGRWIVRDLNSTNGTFLNGRRIAAEAALQDGDRIGCGPAGPVLVVALLGEAVALAGDDLRTVERPTPHATPITVRRSTETPRPARPAARMPYVIGGATLVAALAAGWVLATQDASRRLAELDLSLRRADSLRLASERSARTLSGQLAGLDSALDAERGRTEALLAALRDAQARGQPAALDVARELEAAAARQARLATLADFDYAGVAARNQRAVALVAVEMPDGTASTGTAFGVNAGGLLVTNRHVVTNDAGARPRRVVVKYAGSDRWISARVARVDDRAELATLQVEGAGPFPAVQGVAAAPAAAAAGNPVALIGYPLGTDTPMDRTDSDFVARPSLFGGMVSKAVDGVVQIDAYAGHGSSGSPVFDRRGAVVGVVYGGMREGDGRVVLAVALDRLHAMLPEREFPRLR